MERKIGERFTIDGKTYNGMKEFNLEEAKAGKPVCTRDGRKARILCVDLNTDKYTVVAAVTLDNGKEHVETFMEDGHNYDKNEHNNDLMMVTEKKQGWINVYHDRDYNNKAFINCIPYPTKEEAIKASENVLSSNLNFVYIGTFPFEWEE